MFLNCKQCKNITAGPPTFYHVCRNHVIAQTIRHTAYNRLSFLRITGATPGQVLFTFSVLKPAVTLY